MFHMTKGASNYERPKKLCTKYKRAKKNFFFLNKVLWKPTKLGNEMEKASEMQH